MKYKTKGGRVVYGGGGIMPDIFVPIDTVGSSYYLGSLNYQGIFFQFGFQYVDKNRKSLIKVYEADNFAKKFEVSSDLLQEFYNFAEEKGVEYDEKGASTSETIIRQRLKASIARNLFREKVFYQVVNEDDVVVKSAAEKLSNN